MGNKKELSVKEIQAEFGVSAATVGYYTALGLLHVLRRKGNARHYEALDTMTRLKKIRELLNRGHTLRAIKDQLDENRAHRP